MNVLKEAAPSFFFIDLVFIGVVMSAASFGKDVSVRKRQLCPLAISFHVLSEFMYVHT